MKNYMKKIIVGLLTFAFLFTGIQSVFASGPFNGQSGDCPSIAIGNYTTGVGIADGQWNCWTRQSVTASAGDTINVALFYHNNTASTLTNVSATLSASGTGPSTNYSFSGQIYSDQGSTSLGTVNLSLNSSQTLTYSSAHWMKDKNAINSDTDSAMLYGQNGSVMQNGGSLKIGSVPTGWNDYGYILVVFKVGTTVAPQLCKDTSATNYNGALPCTYPAQTCQDPAASNYRAVGSCTYPAQLCKDTAASNYNGSLPCTYPAQLCKDTAASNYNGAIPCTYPAQLCKDPAASNYNGAIPCVYPPQLCKDTNANNYNGGLPCTYPVTQRYCQDSSATNYRGLLPCEYPVRVCMDPGASNYRYSLPCTYPVRVCTDSSASNYGGALPCYYTPVQQICRDSSASNYLSYGSCIYNQTICRDSSASNYLGYGSCVYNNNNNRCLDTAASNYGSYGSCIYNNYNTPSVSTYYPSNISDTSATVSGYVSSNGSLVNSWIEFPCYGAQYGNKYSQSSSSTSTTVYNLSPNTTYNYCMVAQNTNNSQTYRGTQITFTTTGGSITPIYVNKNVVTTIATNITTSGAQLNGYITNSSYYNSNTYFEYGTTTDLGQRTNSKTTVGNSSMNDFITGLNSNTIYYFRAVSESSNGTSRGSIEVFRTLGAGVVTPIVIQGTTVVGTSSPIMLSITNKYELIGTGDTMDYTVTYKNIGKSKLTKPMIQVVLPSNITLVNASRGTYSVDTHTLSALIEDLDKGQEGVIYIQAKVDSVPANSAQIVTTAILVYTNSNGAQENAMAYAFNVPKQMVVDANSNLGASAFFAGIFSIGLIGWLIIILIILLLILIVRSVYSKSGNSTPTH